MKKTIIAVMLGMVCILSDAQVVIDESGVSGLDTEKYTILEIRNRQAGDGNSGSTSFVLPVASDHKHLPKYNGVESLIDDEMYDDDGAMAGMLMYDQEAGYTKLFDGAKWIPAFTNSDVGGFSRFYIPKYNTLVCVSFICGSGPMPLQLPLGKSDRFYDELDLAGGRNNGISGITIPADGVYRIGINVETETVTTGGGRMQVKIQKNGKNATNFTLESGIFVGIISGSSKAIFHDEAVLCLKTNDVITFHADLDPKSTIGSLLLDVVVANFGGNEENCFVTIERLM
jgi:hypothetical protein